MFQMALVWAALVGPMIGFADTPEELLGEKLFNETRFSQFYFERSGADTNKLDVEGDPVLELLHAEDRDYPHPFRGKHMSCAGCHFVDHATNAGLKIVTYNDFTSRTPVSDRKDGENITVRNTSNLVGAMVEDGLPLHWDGEFFNASDLSCSSLVGRNMGWKAEEAAVARRHIVHVLRQDDGTFPSSSDLEGNYRSQFSNLGIEFDLLSDEALLRRACDFIAIYMRSLDFARDGGGYIGSAYDQFLKLNGISREPSGRQSQKDYVEELREIITTKQDWKWVGTSRLQSHSHAAQFGELELEGMRLFFTRAQCVSCHAPPRFTDSLFHVTGNNQLEYERAHGSKSFLRIHIPGLSERLSSGDRYLIPTEEHPTREGVFRRIPSTDRPEFADLGVWNLLFHPDKQSIQVPLREAVCKSLELEGCALINDDVLLEKSVGMFKTPTLRSLGQSGPYFSTGSSRNLAEVLQVYMIASEFSRRGRLRNASPFLKKMEIRPHHFQALQAFMEALDEDYE